eukprot:gene16983-20186_t
MLLVADLDDDTYEPPLDATPPVITLNGAVQIELRQLDSYVDAGATAYDADTGLFVSVTVRGLEELEECLADTTCNTTDSTRGPFLIVYAAEDASGNQAAAVVRQVEVATFCPPPAYLCEDAVGRECATCETVEDSDTGEAREFCVCLGYNIDAAPTVKVEAYKSPADLLPPVLTLHGEAPLGITSSGTVVMLHTVLEGEVWSDPGVDAWDETDGNLSQVVTSFGGGAVDTSLARPDPFVITYSVSDAAENAAVEVQRRVHVINPCAGGAEAEETGEAEYICHYDESTKEVVCSENGLCSSLQLSAEEEETAPVPEPPALQRFGPRTISISEGDALYTVCPADGEEIGQCELGEELCDDLTCSDVPCETRDSWSTAPADTTPPVITLLQPSPVQLTYGNASAAAELRPCEQSPSVDADPPCVATAQDDQSGDVSATLVVTQDHACSSCSTAGCLLERVHLCLSGTYGYLFEAEDEAGNRGIARLLVTVVEAAELDAGVILSADTSVIAEAEAQAALLLNSSSPEARAFAQGMAELLNTASTTAGEPLTASDIRITRVIVQTAGALLDEEQPSAELSLVVSFTTRVAVAGVAGEAVRRRLLKDDNGSALTSRTDDMAEIYAAAAQDGRMTASLDEAAVMATISLGNVLGLVGPVESTPLSPEVDVAGAWAVSIEAEILGLQAQGSQLSTATQRIRDTLTNAGGDPDVWRAHLLEVWFKAQQGDFERLDSLLASIEELKVKYTLSFMRAQLVQANQIDAQIALQEAVGSIQNIAEASQE